MAEGGIDPLHCAICLESYKTPKFLPCHHSFCASCLEGYIYKNSCDNKINCPLCRKTCSVPPNGVDGYVTNFYVGALEKLTLGRGSVTCDFCESKANKYCCECDQTFCTNCISNIHSKLKRAKGHTLNDINETVAMHCLVHPDVVFTCNKCNATFDTGQTLFKVEHIKDIKLPTDKTIMSIAPICGSNNCWVSVNGSPELCLMDREGQLIKSVPIGNGTCKCAATDSKGNAIVSSYDGQRLVKVTQRGMVETVLGGLRINSPHGLTCIKHGDADDDVLFAGCTSGKVMLYSSKTKALNFILSLSQTFDVAQGEDSGIFCVSDSGKSEIVIFEKNGKVASRFRRALQTFSPTGVCFDHKNCVIVADNFSKEVLRISRDGILVQVLVKGLKNCVMSVSLDSDRFLWVGLGNGNIKVYRLI